MFQHATLLRKAILATLLVGPSLLAISAAIPTAYAAEAARVVFVVGAVHSDTKQLTLGQSVDEGNLIATGADGYVYLKTVDDGFLILRPNTQARIVAYRIDKQQPGNSRIKLDLLGGVARSISGEGVKQARQNFRFNTPVAAIGVRGTDFTVFTDQDTSRVAVVSGGVVVSPFAGGCQPEGGGPCEGNTSRELFANQLGHILQVEKGQSVPQLLRGTAVVPESAAPARADEPSARLNGAGNGARSNAFPLPPAELSVTTDKDVKVQSAVLALGNSAIIPVAPPAPPPVAPPVNPPEVIPPPVVVPPVVVDPVVIPPVVVPPVVVTPPIPEVPPPPQITWGRWQKVLDQSANLDLDKVMDGSQRMIAISSQFALLRQKSADWQVPHEGSIGFALQQSEAYILDEPRKTLSAATIENGKLNVDFATASFSTSLELVSQAAERFHLQAQGMVTANGMLEGRSQFSSPTNMQVNGALGAEKSGAAAYLFQSRLDNTRVGTGATYWTSSH